MSAPAPIKGCHKLPAGSAAGGVCLECGRLDTKACNRPNHFSFALNAPTRAGASRWHEQIIHAADLGGSSPIFVKQCASASMQNDIDACEAVMKKIFVTALRRCRTPSVTDAKLLAGEAGRSSHLRLTAQLAPATPCNATVPVVPNYETMFPRRRKWSWIVLYEFSITHSTYQTGK